MKTGWQIRVGIFIIGIFFSSFRLLYAGTLTGVTITSEVTNVAGSYTSFNLVFTTSAAGSNGITGIPTTGKIRVVFPAGFDCDYATIGTSNNPATLNGGLVPQWHQDESVVMVRDGTGTATLLSTTVDVSFGNVLLPNTPGVYTITIETRNSDSHPTKPGIIIDAGTASFTVGTGGFHHFKIVGYPTTKTAGQTFTGNNITVSARDASDNLVTSYVGEMYFTSSDAAAVLPYTSAAKYTFTVGDAGTHTFSGSEFTLKTAGNQTISAYDVTSASSWPTNSIQVTPAAIAAFNFTVPTPQTAGAAFALNVTGAVDAFNNATSGTIVISNSANADNSPNGQTPVFNTISVSNGVGSANQILVRAASGVILKGVAGSFEKTTNSFTVNAGAAGAVKIYSGASGQTSEVGDFTITSASTSVMHAVGFDIYGNYTGDISANWSVSGGIGSVDPATGISTTFTAGQVGTGKVTANRAGAIGDDTGLITVNPSAAGVADIRIQNAPGKAGQRMDQAITMTTDDVLTLYAVKVDAGGNYIEDATTAVWSLSMGNLLPAINHTGAKFTFNPTTAGRTGKISARQGLYDDETGLITVNVGAFHHYQIRRVPKVGSTYELNADSLTVEETMSLYAYGFDADNNPMTQPKMKVNWSLISGADKGTFTQDPGDQYKMIFNPRKTGTCIIRAQSPTDTSKFDDSGLIKVKPGAIKRLLITTESEGRGSQINNQNLNADQVLRLWASAVDSFNNYVGQASPKWNILGNLEVNFDTTTTRAYIDFNPKKAGSSGRIYVRQAKNPPDFAGDTTGTITVIPGALHHLRPAVGVLTKRYLLGDTTLTVGDTLLLHTAGYDADDNYIGVATPDTIQVLGPVGRIVRVPGQAGLYYFLASRSGNGLLRVLKTGVVEGYSGNIQVNKGSIHHVLIRDATAGKGNKVNNVNLTTDETLKLYAAAYDAGDTYLDAVNVTWKSNGTLSPPVNVTSPDSVFEFAPDKPGIGRILITHTASGSKDSIQTVQVQPGIPYGNITLTPDPRQIPADDTTVSTITSSTILDRKGNQVLQNTLFTVHATAGQIITPDADLVTAGIQVPVNANGKIQFQLKATAGGGTATITAGSGLAQGITTVSISNLNLISVTATQHHVTQGQTGIQVRMVVQNLGETPVPISEADLSFKGTGNTNRYADYVVTPPGTLPTLVGGETKIIEFTVGVQATAVLDTVVIDGKIYSDDVGIGIEHANVVDGWRVQRPAALKIIKMEALESQVAQGGRGLDITMRVQNSGGFQAAAALIDAARPTFWLGAINVTSQYVSTIFGSLPNRLATGQEATIRFKVNINNGANEGEVTISGEVQGRDANSLRTMTSTQVDTTDSWRVQKAAKVQIAAFTPSQSTVTRSQTKDWHATLLVQNNGYNPVQFDSCRLQIYKLNANITSEYKIVYSQTFISGFQAIAPESEDSLRIVIDQTGPSTGTMTLQATIYLSDLGAGGDQLEDRRETQIQVQDPASVAILDVRPSYPEATRNQTKDWQVRVALQNLGGSDIKIDTTVARSNVQFSPGTNYLVKRPFFKSTGGIQLARGKQDTLLFTVDRTGASVGSNKITVTLTAKELNSGNEIAMTDTSAKIMIQTEPKVRIKTVTNDARNAPQVNRKQNFNITVNLENAGGLTADEADSVVVQLTSNRQPQVVWEKILNNVKPLIENKLSFQVTAADTHGITEQYTANVASALADNTHENVPPDLPISNRIQVELIQPADLKVVKMLLPDTVQARQYKPWEISLVVKNEGQAQVLFDKPTKNDLVFKVNGQEQTDYQITPPATLKGGDLYLEAGKPDTLTYTVIRTGGYPGNVSITLNLRPTDRNDPARVFPIQPEGNLYMATSARMRIVGIEPSCYYIGQNNEGQINQGQNFKIGVTVENGGAEAADSVLIELSADTNYVSFPKKLILEYVGIEERRTLEFAGAAKQIAEAVEFSAKIISAKGHSSHYPVPIDDSFKGKAFIRIHEPSKLELTLKTQSGLTTFATAQEFNVLARVSRTGTSRLDNAGRLTVEVPNGYTLISPATAGFSIADGANEAELMWTVRTPATNHAAAAVVVTMTTKPQDRYANKPASTVNTRAEVPVETVESSLRISALRILSPDGARDGTVSTGQWFKIQASVIFSNNVTHLKAQLNVPITDANNHYEITATDSSRAAENPAVWIWTITAPQLSVSAKDFEVIATGTEQAPNDVTHRSTLTVTTVSRTFLSLELSSSQGTPTQGLILSTGQNFTIATVIKNTGVANATGMGYVSLNLGITGVTTSEPLQKSFMVNAPVTWQLKSANIAIGAQYVTVTLDSLPDDENRSETAFIPDQDRIKRISVTTLDRGVIEVSNIHIESPVGAQDQILSTYQTFNLAATFNWQRCQKVQAAVIYPAFFECENNIKTPAGNELSGNGQVTFTLKALSNAALSQPIKVIVSATDAYNLNQSIQDTSQTLLFSLVGRARGELKARTDAPNNLVSVGQRFKVKAWLFNHGQAAFDGNYTAEISAAGTEYTLDSPTQQTTFFGDTLSWQVIAPPEPLAGKNLRVMVKSWPQDINTNQEIAYINTEIEIPVITEEKRVIVTNRLNITPRAISKGQKNVTLLGLVFQNVGNASSNRLLLRGMQVKLRDRQGEVLADPSQVIRRLAAVRANNSNIIYGQVDPVGASSQINLHFNRIDTIQGGRPDSLNLLVDISPDASILNFQISIDTTTAFNLVDYYSGLPPKFYKPDGTLLTQLKITSDFSSVLEADLEKTFLNYPNPFGNHGQERTKFIYYLAQNTDVELKIFTVLGEQVWSVKYAEHTPEGRAGMHAENFYGSGGPPIYWDGTNQDGNKILNGIYIAVFTTTNGGQSTTKVAVLK
ncbi:hypothetical protein L0128_04205 [candidate division KSB1 bacterium]|nr:hypothetical protein [candidate division KSB1 bacterium]